MGSQAKKRALLWAQAQLKTYTTEEILTQLYKVRTFYLNCWISDLEKGNIKEGPHYYSMIKRVTNLFEDIRNQRGQADVLTAQTMAMYPLMLAPSEMIDFSSLLDGSPIGEGLAVN